MFAAVFGVPLIDAVLPLPRIIEAGGLRASWTSDSSESNSLHAFFFACVVQWRLNIHTKIELFFLKHSDPPVTWWAKNNISASLNVYFHNRCPPKLTEDAVWPVSKDGLEVILHSEYIIIALPRDIFDKRSLLLTMAPPTLTAPVMADGLGETLICTPLQLSILY